MRRKKKQKKKTEAMKTKTHIFFQTNSHGDIVGVGGKMAKPVNPKHA